MYYDGQIITDHKAFANWTNSHGNKFYDESNGDGTYTVHEKSAPTETEIIAQQVAELKAELSSTDYKAIKFAEGWISEEDYAPIKAHRQELRDKINELENGIEQVEQEEPIVDTVGEEPEQGE